MTDLPITYLPHVIANPDAILHTLQTELEWERRSDAPRGEYYCNDIGEPYTYGNGAGRRTYLARPYHAVILDIRKQLEEYVSTAFPAVKPFLQT
jgi:hypothetical protein